MFGIGLLELAVLMFVAVCFFGPDKLPDFARQAAHAIRRMKGLSDGARDELRTQLGPEYADLELRDLDPRAILRRHVTSAFEDDWDSPDDADSPNDGADDADWTHETSPLAGSRNPIAQGDLASHRHGADTSPEALKGPLVPTASSGPAVPAHAGSAYDDAT